MKKRLLALLFLLGLPPGMPATTMVPMYLDDLTAASQTVVYGKVISSRTEWDAGHNWIFTIYTVVPAAYLKGQLGAAFELREPGGERDGVGMRVAAVPVFQPGEEAVLFVWTDSQGRHQVSAFEQGAVRIQTDAVTGAKTASRAIPIGSARAGGSIVSSLPVTSRTLQQMLDQIRSSVARTSQTRSGQ